MIESFVKSPKVPTLRYAAEMSAPEVCEKFVEAIKFDNMDVIINFGEPDMAGR